MYNGNGNRYNSGGSWRAGIPPLYQYIGIGVLVLLGIWLLSSFLSAGMEGYFALAAGVLLVLGNLRDLIATPYPQRNNVSLMNTLIGGGLITFFLGKGGFPPIGGLWYVAALALLLVAAPLMLGRATVYTAYLGTARNVIGGVRRAVSDKIRTY